MCRGILPTSSDRLPPKFHFNQFFFFFKFSADPQPEVDSKTPDAADEPEGEEKQQTDFFGTSTKAQDFDYFI